MSPNVSRIFIFRLTGVLNDTNRGFYLVARSEGKPVGSLMITYEWSDWRNGNLWWIQSVYVVPSSRDQGIFRRLYEEVTAFFLPSILISEVMDRG